MIRNPIFFGLFRLVVFGMLWFLESPVGRKSSCVNKLLNHDPIAMSWTNSGCIDSSTPWSSSVWPGSLLVSWPSFISDLSISWVSSSNTSLPAVLISSSSLPWLLLFFALALLFSLLCFGSSNRQKPPTWKKLPRLGKIGVLLRRFGLCFRPFSRDLKFGEVGEPFQQICSPICSKLSARIINMLQTMLMAFQSGILNDFIFEPYLYPFQCWVRWNVTSSSWRSTSSNKSVSTCRFQTSWPNSLSNMENLGHSNPYIDMIIWSNWNEQWKEAFVALNSTGWVRRILIMAHYNSYTPGTVTNLKKNKKKTTTAFFTAQVTKNSLNNSLPWHRLLGADVSVASAVVASCCI